MYPAPENPPKSESESLGTQVIEGVTAEGTRSTTTLAIGSVGNDREIVVTHERWFSKQLQIEVLSKTSDPRLGVTVTKLTEVKLTEPDPTLFMPPADYTATEVPGPTVTR